MIATVDLVDPSRQPGDPPFTDQLRCAGLLAAGEGRPHGACRPFRLDLTVDRSLPAACAGPLHRRVADEGIRVVLLPHTAAGLELAPLLALALDAALVTGVDGVSSGPGGPWLRRLVERGRRAHWIDPGPGRLVATVAAGSFSAGEGCEQADLPVETLTVGPSQTGQAGAYVAIRDAADGLAGARVVVAAGRGIGSERNLESVRRLAALFPGSAVAGSRAAVDLGWLPYPAQVGQTGATVAPDLYLACGISGTGQHLAGMRQSGFVVAINTDPDAPIMGHADICVVDDALLFLPALAEALAENGRPA